MSDFFGGDNAVEFVDPRGFVLFRGENLSANVLGIPGVNPHEFHRFEQGVLADISDEPHLALVPFGARNGKDVLEIIANPFNIGHLTSTAWGYDAKEQMRLKTDDDIRRIADEQSDPDNFVRDFAVVVGPHYDESTGMFRNDDEVIGNVRHTVRSHARNSHIVDVFIDRAHTRQGFGFRALELMKWAVFQRPDSKVLHAYIHPDNFPAVALARKANMSRSEELVSGMNKMSISRGDAGY
ncbi:GNAT family N-acetyltransferase [Candidatus Saccharibacteria bacterium]|nr:GNAT family N-acetyltransferase [Candidatus Saccharibacteria bacterium]